MPLRIVHQDITTMQVDAIVNAANTRLLMGGGVCGAIFRAAGARDMQEACDRLSPILTGCAVATPGFALSARYVIQPPARFGRAVMPVRNNCCAPVIAIRWSLLCRSAAEASHSR